MHNQLVLSLFHGADLFGRAFEMEWPGFTVVNGPDILMGKDIRGWHIPRNKFDGIIGSPPCKCFSKAIASRGGGEAATEGNLIPEFERLIVEGNPRWWVMECVPEAPIPMSMQPNSGWEYLRVQWYRTLDAWAFGASQHRTRRFSSNLFLAPHAIPEAQRHTDPWPTVTATEYKCSEGSNERVMRQRAGRKVGRRLTLEEMKEAFGLPNDFDTPCLLNSYKYIVIGNGVPISMGRAVARSVMEALGIE